MSSFTIRPPRAPQDAWLPRVRVARISSALVGDTGIGSLLDLSHAGCLVETGAALRCGDEPYLTFAASPLLSFVVPVRVMFSRPGRRASSGEPCFVTGFEFDVSRQPDLHRGIDILLDRPGARLPVH